MNDDGTVSVSFLEALNGEPKRWREIEPFVWREVDGKDLLAARVENGRVTMFTGDEISPFMVFTPPPAWKSPGLLSGRSSAPSRAAAHGADAWPVAALVRRHYHATYALEGRQALAHKWVRIAATATIVVPLGWGFTVAARSSPSLRARTRRSTAGCSCSSSLGLVVFVGAALRGPLARPVVWTGGRRWPAKTWSVVLARPRWWSC